MVHQQRKGVRVLRHVIVCVVALVAAMWLAPPAVAQTPEPGTVQALGLELVEAREAHLWRVAGWGGASLLAGLGLIAGTSGSTHPGWRGFGIQAAAWGAINLGIVGWAFASGFDAPATGLGSALAAEDAWGNILLVNVGLNVGYMLVGGGLAIAAGHGMAHPDAVRGHGLGVVVQGLGLLVLDGIAYAGSRGRMEALQGIADRAAPGPVPGSLDVTLLSLGVR